MKQKPNDARECELYWCPTAEDYECCGTHGGFGVCCAQPQLHQPLTDEQVREIAEQRALGSTRAPQGVNRERN